MAITFDIPDAIEQRLRLEYPDLEKEFLTIVGLHLYCKKVLNKSDVCSLLSITELEVSTLLLERDIGTTIVLSEMPNAEDVALAKTASDSLKKSYQGGELHLIAKSDGASEEIVLPEEIANMLVYMIHEIAKGNGIAIKKLNDT